MLIQHAKEMKYLLFSGKELEKTEYAGLSLRFCQQSRQVAGRNKLIIKRAKVNIVVSIRL